MLESLSPPPDANGLHARSPCGRLPFKISNPLIFRWLPAAGNYPCLPDWYFDFGINAIFGAGMQADFFTDGFYRLVGAVFIIRCCRWLLWCLAVFRGMGRAIRGIIVRYSLRVSNFSINLHECSEVCWLEDVGLIHSAVCVYNLELKHPKFVALEDSWGWIKLSIQFFFS